MDKNNIEREKIFNKKEYDKNYKKNIISNLIQIYQ